MPREPTGVSPRVMSKRLPTLPAALRPSARHYPRRTRAAASSCGGGTELMIRRINSSVVIPSASVHRIQEAQTTAYHVLWTLVQEALGAVPGERQ